MKKVDILIYLKNEAVEDIISIGKEFNLTVGQVNKMLSKIIVDNLSEEIKKQRVIRKVKYEIED